MDPSRPPTPKRSLPLSIVLSNPFFSHNSKNHHHHHHHHPLQNPIRPRLRVVGTSPAVRTLERRLALCRQLSHPPRPTRGRQDHARREDPRGPRGSVWERRVCAREAQWTRSYDRSVGVEEGDWGSNASTMATLLRLFEPPPTTTSTCNSNKSIILIIDEFDLFALHPRQSFLYSLLDIVQGNRRKTGVGVVGISSRTDCLSILEKRVRSRCQSQVHQVMLPNSREDYFERLRELLVVADDWQGLRGEDDGGMEETVEDWNAKVEAFCKDQDVKDYFERLWKIHGNVPTFLLQALSEMMAKLDYSAQHSSADWSSPAPKEMRVPDLDISLLPSVTTSEGKGKRDDLLQQCTTLELVVCVAAKHVRNIHEDNCLNLEMLYSCYKQHLGRTELKGGASAKAYSKMAFAMALDSLRQQEVFIPATGKSQHYFPPSLGDSFRQLKFVPWNSTVDEVVMERQDVPLPVRKWCKHWAD
ncbi:hypothetical protein T439DRAFT_19823 [Meredithblackwellia eburnea MCA 4105]